MVRIFIFMLLFSNYLIASDGDENTTVKLDTLQETMEKSFADINKHLDSIQYQQQNRIVPYKDIESLYDYVIGSDYTFKTPRCYPDGSASSTCDKNVSKIDAYYALAWIDNDKLIFVNANVSEDDTGAVNRFKLLAMEECLFNEQNGSTTGNNTTKERIQRIYEEINYKDWDQDRIRFIVLTDYLMKRSASMVSAGVQVFPSYRKYIPGNVNLPQRYSLYFAIGAMNNSNDNYEYKGVSYSSGLNLEIQKGFGIHLGWAFYTINDPSVSDKFNNEDSLVAGISLSSELWKNLFGFAK